ncbi:MAG: VOC family protein [Rhodospirillales bacterium]|jgi:catechol 2,3-dioxygenase-like lactoylglutathione lyase family enzyme
MSDVIHMHHVALATADLDSTLKFYTDVVGLKAGPTPSSSGRLQWMYAGENPVLHIFQPKVVRDAPVSGVYGIAHFALHISNFDEAVARLKSHDIEYSENEMESRAARQVFFDGPDGVRVELIELGSDEHLAKKWREPMRQAELLLYGGIFAELSRVSCCIC